MIHQIDFDVSLGKMHFALTHKKELPIFQSIKNRQRTMGSWAAVSPADKS